MGIDAASFSRLVKVYQDGIDSLISNLGKPMLLLFKQTTTGTVNESFHDQARNDDNLKPSYKQTSVSPAPIVTYNGKIIQSLVKWNIKNYETYGIRIDDETKSIIRLKSYLTDVADLERCDFVIPNVSVNPFDTDFYYIPINQPQNNIISKDDYLLWYDSYGNPICYVKNNITHKFKILRGAQPVGLQQDRYNITYWQEV